MYYLNFTIKSYILNLVLFTFYLSNFKSDCTILPFVNGILVIISINKYSSCTNVQSKFAVEHIFVNVQIFSLNAVVKQQFNNFMDVRWRCKIVSFVYSQRFVKKQISLCGIYLLSAQQSYEKNSSVLFSKIGWRNHL